jgi:DNA replication protein DnaC
VAHKEQRRVETAVVVDEVGYTPIDREECNLFFRFIANRYEKASTVITSNKAFSDWAELLHDPIIITVILERPFAIATSVVFLWTSKPTYNNLCFMACLLGYGSWPF